MLQSSSLLTYLSCTNVVRTVSFRLEDERWMPFVQLQLNKYFFAKGKRRSQLIDLAVALWRRVGVVFVLKRVSQILLWGPVSVSSS
jgi:hypothetical protein